jgi:hypothetical protein
MEQLSEASNAPARRQAIRDMVQASNPKLVCLQETKLAVVTPQLAADILGQRFNEHRFLPADGTKGGILVGWHTDYIEASNILLKWFSITMDIKA